jgi:aminomethyltransferase
LSESTEAFRPSAPVERTCLYDQHVALGATLIDFHGWMMPVRYGSIPEEHAKVRLCAGIFDLCHMGRLEIAGRDAVAWVDRVITNDCSRLKPGDARYTLLCTESGSILEDAIVYRLLDSIFLVVNASNRPRVIEWLEEHKLGADAGLHDRTKSMAMIAVQGPQAVRILPQAIDRIDADWLEMKYYSIAGARIAGKPARIARTGYTGEDGFEVYLDSEDAPTFWTRVLEVGGNRVAPIGLGARDTLRLEAGMPLYGNDIDLGRDPFEAGLGFAVKLDKATPFVGQEGLRQRKASPPKQILRGFHVTGRRVARQGMDIVQVERSAPAEGDTAGSAPPSAPVKVGIITSGAPSPTLGHPIAMGYLDSSLVPKESSGLAVDVRGNLEPIEFAELPFYSRTRKKAKK